MKYLFLVLVFFFIIYFNIKGKKPKIHKKILLRDIDKYFELLFFYGNNRGFIVIRLSKNKNWIQFSKYLNKKNEIGIQFDYPLAEWSKDYYKRVKKLLKENGIKFVLEKTEIETVKEFIVIDFKNDFEKIIDFIKLFFFKIYNAKNDDHLELHYWNINVHYEIVGETNIVPKKINRSPRIAINNAEHWGLVIGRFIGSLTRLVFPPKNK